MGGRERVVRVYLEPPAKDIYEGIAKDLGQVEVKTPPPSPRGPTRVIISPQIDPAGARPSATPTIVHRPAPPSLPPTPSMPTIESAPPPPPPPASEIPAPPSVPPHSSLEKLLKLLLIKNQGRVILFLLMKGSSLGKDFLRFLNCLWRYVYRRLFGFLLVLESSKTKFASQLYQRRGKYARPFMHSGMVILVIAGVALGPVLVAEANSELDYDLWEKTGGSVSVLSASAMESTYTFISEKPRAEVIDYQVKEGDTLSSIANRYGVSVETIVWQNGLSSDKAKIKAGQALRVLPTTGLLHQVKRGETIYSIAKKYDVSPQAVVDWPYNTFINDETFALAVGQDLMVPDGVMPKAVPAPRRDYAQVAPGTGIVTGTGQFVWPAGGKITQWYRAWHRGIDIANKSLPGIVAADSGTVTIVGWPSPWAYGNRILVDHGNGYQTLYAHLSRIYVGAGQRVERGQVIGQMGSTGRSTGPHLHFEIRRGGAAVDPMGFLK